jgi:hypothetical protein
MALAAADALVAPVARIDGFPLACVIDASTGMLLASAQDNPGISLPVAAAGAADIAQVLSLLTNELAHSDELEDLMVTFSDHFYLVRSLGSDPRRQLLLLVILDRSRANLAMARREIRHFCASFTA